MNPSISCLLSLSGISSLHDQSSYKEKNRGDTISSPITQIPTEMVFR